MVADCWHDGVGTVARSFNATIRRMVAAAVGATVWMTVCGRDRLNDGRSTDRWWQDGSPAAVGQTVEVTVENGEQTLSRSSLPDRPAITPGFLRPDGLHDGWSDGGWIGIRVVRHDGHGDGVGW
jgi:hypothetical protein